MKFVKLFLIFSLLIFLVGITSAHSYPSYDYDDLRYKEKITKTLYEDDEVITRTLYVNYDDVERYSTSKYKYGWSYRDTEDYWGRRHERALRDYEWYDGDNWDERDVWDVYDYDDRYDYDKWDDYYDKARDRNRDRQNNLRKYHKKVRYDSEAESYTKYNPVTKAYETRECYESAPEGRLFYVKCPWA